MTLDRRRTRPINRDEERAKREAFYDRIRRFDIDWQEAVVAMRDLSRLTQDEFAKNRQISLSTLRAIEQKTSDPRVSTLNRIGDIFGLEVGFVPKKPKNDASGIKR